MRKSWRSLLLPPVLLLFTTTVLANPEHLMRYADVHDDMVVFTYEDDLWLVSTSGGDARRLTNGPGSEYHAKFSPDGRQIAFTAQYDGGRDVYVMPAGGGVPQRLTYHPSHDRVLGWWPDGSAVLFRAGRDFRRRGEQVYRVSVTGGTPERLPIDRAGLLTIAPDGQRVAYNRLSRESRTWKRHRGGTAQDIWYGSLKKKDYRKVVDSDWSDNFPMWHENAVYFTSDREDGTLNIYKYDVDSAEISRITSYADYDVKYPSMGDGRIVFQYREKLHLLDLASGDVQEIAVRIPTDLTRMRPDLVRVSSTTGPFSLSPTGKRLAVEARGEILNLPVASGNVVNLTRAPGAREKNAAWSPDGRFIAYLSDKTGEEEVYLVDQHRSADPKQLTRGGLGFRMHLVWSPDSRWLVFSDKFMRLNLVDAASGEITVIDQAELDDAWERWGIQDYTWSPDSQWIAYTKMERSGYDSIFLYSLAGKEKHRVTSDQQEDWSPSFDPQGAIPVFPLAADLQPDDGIC